MTSAELSALPEFRNTREILQDDGTMVIERIAPKFVGRQMNPKDVILFHDAEGSWFVDYHLEGGPYKRRACL